MSTMEVTSFKRPIQPLATTRYPFLSSIGIHVALGVCAQPNKVNNKTSQP